jgi:alcohol dehydrogenase (cytochrome c)
MKPTEVCNQDNSTVAVTAKRMSEVQNDPMRPKRSAKILMRSLTSRALFATACLLLSWSASADYAGPSQDELDRATDDSENWLYVDHDYHGTRFSALAEITTKNVRKLSRSCLYTFPEKEPSQTAPLVYKGVIYATTSHYTVALDGANCRLIWQYKWQPRAKEIVRTQRGAAIKDGQLVRGTSDGFLLALNAATGKEIWTRQIADSTSGYFISMPPLIVGDLIYIGPAGAEWASKGWVGAFRLADGERVWKFNTVPDLAEPGAETWGNSGQGLRFGGGSVWTPLSFDRETNLLYVPVGNVAPDFYDKDRPGDNLYTSSVVALDATTGKLVWHYQTVPHDQRDYDLTHVSPIFTIERQGKRHTVIAVTGKDGLLRLFDRDDHRLIYSVAFTKRMNADVPIGVSPVHICPGTVGGHEWSGSAYSPRSNTLFVPATDWCADVHVDETAPSPAADNTKGPFYFGGDAKFAPWTEAAGWLTAFDATTGKEKWKYRAAKPMIGGVLASAGELVFSGELNGDFEAFDATNGKILYKSNVGGPVGGGIVSYTAAGKQRVAVVSGFVGLYNDVAPDLGGANTTISVFALK